MKNIVWLLIVLFISTGVYAQEKALTQAQFDAVYQGSLEAWSLDNWRGKPFRRIIITGSRLEGRPQTDYTSKSIVEYASPTDFRTVYESSLGAKKSKTESVRSGDKIYFRKDDGDWQNGTRQSPTEGVKPPPADKAASEDVEYKFLGTEKLGNQTAKVYAVHVKTKRINSADGQETIADTTTKYWFGEDGILLKTDMVAESRTGEKTYHTLVTQIWEADENIKIIAPTLNAAQQK